MKRALLADGRLWLLSDAGELSSISEGGETRDEASLPEPALEICAREGHIEAITCAADGCASWTLRPLTKTDRHGETGSRAFARVNSWPNSVRSASSAACSETIVSIVGMNARSA